MHSAIFGERSGHPVPLLPCDGQGVLREPDGATIFSLTQAAARWELPESDLAALHQSFFDGLVDFAAAGASVPRVGKAVADRVLRQIRFGHLTEDEFEFVRAQCRELRVPLARVWIKIQTNNGRREPVVQMHIDGLRQVAEQSGEYVGQRGPFWCGADGKWVNVWLPKEPPAAARVGVLRRGYKTATWSVAKWDAYAQIDPNGKRGALTRYWAEDGANALAKCAESLSLRRAFPGQLARVYSIEEMMQADNPRQVAAAPEHRRVVVTEDSPQTRWQLELKMLDLGFGRPQQRAEIIARFASQYQEMAESNPPLFFATLLDELQRNPARYGAG